MKDWFTSHWQRKRRQQDSSRRKGMITASKVKGRIQVCAPFSEDFRVKAPLISGHWKDQAQVWSFPIDREADLLSLLKRIYGVDVTIRRL